MKISTFSRARRWCSAALIASALVLPAQGALFIEDIHEAALPEYDAREAQAAIAPTATQLALADALGATVRWNHYGTPQTLIKHGGFLATGLNADAEVAARDFLAANAELFRLSAADVAALELYHVGDFAHSDAKAIKFRQNFGGLASQGGGLVTVGVIDGKVAIATSSLVDLDSSASVPAANLTAADAVAIAAADAGFNVTVADLSLPGAENDWTTFEATGMVGTQRAKSMAFPTPNGVHNVFETWTISNDAGKVTSYMHLVDATDGTILFRQDKVFQYADGIDHRANAKRGKGDALRAPETFAFQGEFSAPPGPFECGPLHGPYNSNGTTHTRIIVVANATVATNDILINLYYDDGISGATLISTIDVGFGEALVYEPGGLLPAGDYFAEVCPLQGSINQNWLAPFTYEGTFTFDDTPLPSIGNDPRWFHFTANPLPDLTSTDIRELGCWLNPGNDAVCDFTIANTAARGPWDFDFNAGAPTNTTIGNAAISGEAWLSPLTPAEQYRPTASNRNYSFPWTNVWYTSGCSVGNFVPGVGNDIDAAVTNMFVAHNRMHDWAYYLGWTELNSNLQTDNFGNTAPDRENDALLGNVQAGAIDGAFPAYLGRDNANYVPTPDGAPGITNQYLWQALLGAIYVPCADGNYDMGIVGHEVGHGIQHRMTGGPGTGLGGTQGREMGEGWGDLTGMEYQNGMGVVPVQGESPFAIGSYVLGSPELGIRNFNMAVSPLNYSNIQYDPFGNGSPHSDGEIWSATNFRVRAALVEQHNTTHPATDMAQQRACAEGDEAPQNCPGNRRWIQLMHDGFLLQPAAPSMLDARDAQMAADVMRFTDDAQFGDHQDALWLAYARSGMGANALSAGSGDNNPTSDFSLPASHSLDNANIDFVAKNIETGNFIEADIFVGHFEARANPVATTAATGAPAGAAIAPGSYEMVARADGYGHFRFNLDLAAGQIGTITVNMPTNHASSVQGASASGEGSGHAKLLDDTEATAWVFNGQVGTLTGPDPQGVPGSAPVADPVVVTVVLPQPTTVNRVQVSALPENGNGNRFDNLRQFEVWGCNAGIVSSCTSDGDFTLMYQSSLDAFNGQPIRPLAPNLTIRSFDLTSPGLVSHVQLRALHNQCTGSTEFTRNDWATG
ncbi:MAG: M36 family metallopeptidase, partial [Gammaproteobacteria bacterium]|nr:M36 family metallopeptidase [Gammaproteobacteria bacterium]